MTRSFWYNIAAVGAVLAAGAILFDPARPINDELPASALSALHPATGHPTLFGFIVVFCLLIALACLSIRVVGSDGYPAFLPVYSAIFLPPIGVGLTGRPVEAIVILGWVMAIRETIDISHAARKAFLAAFYLGVASIFSLSALFLYAFLLPVVFSTKHIGRRWPLFLAGFLVPFITALIAGGPPGLDTYASGTESAFSPSRLPEIAATRMGILRVTADLSFLGLYLPFILAAILRANPKRRAIGLNPDLVLLYLLAGLAALYTILPVPARDERILLATLVVASLLIANVGRCMLESLPRDKERIQWARILVLLYLTPPVIAFLRLVF